jgi:hypothetical protein
VKHPSSLDLEAFATGEPFDTVARHLDGCAACAGFVERLRGAIRSSAPAGEVDDAVARAARGGAFEEEPPAPDVVFDRLGERLRAAALRHWLLRAAPPALTAALLLFIVLRGPSANQVGIPRPVASPPPVMVSPGEALPGTTFKGIVPIAVIREREGQQERLTGAVRVRPRDRLRIEVALDHEQAILAAVLGDDGSWLELMSDAVRGPGTHFSERSARVDASPMQGTILVGSPEAVARARATRRFDEVSTLRIEWEEP